MKNMNFNESKRMVDVFIKLKVFRMCLLKAQTLHNNNMFTVHIESYPDVFQSQGLLEILKRRIQNTKVKKVL